jgi:uncharacterized membrane protein
MNNSILGIIILVLLSLSLPFQKTYYNSTETTYTKDAQPIFKSRCSVCHNEYMPDKNWMDYKIAFGKKDLIKAKMIDKSMPPGNSTNITDDERKTLIKWADDGGKK